jgi:hypothetical protein
MDVEPPDKIRPHIEQFLSKRGYPLEYEVARTLRRTGYETRQGVHHRFFNDARAREIDVVATEPDGMAAPREHVIYVDLTVECKHSPRAWLALTTDERPGELDAPDVTIATQAAREGLREMLLKPPLPFPLQMVEWHAFNVVTTDLQESSKPDPAYLAVNSAVNAAIGQVQKHPYAYSIVFPVVVLAAPLWRLRLMADGTEKLDPVQWQRVIWEGGAAERVMLDIVTRERLPAYANEMRKATKQIAAWFNTFDIKKQAKEKRRDE